MTNTPTGYWCPICGDLATTTNPFPWTPGTAWKHAVDCSGPFVFVPVFTPLAVPEVTTWGESGGVEAVTNEKGCFVWRLGDSTKNMVGMESTDIVSAINYVAGAK